MKRVVKILSVLALVLTIGLMTMGAGDKSVMCSGDGWNIVIEDGKYLLREYSAGGHLGNITEFTGTQGNMGPQAQANNYCQLNMQ